MSWYPSLTELHTNYVQQPSIDCTSISYPYIHARMNQIQYSNASHDRGKRYIKNWQTLARSWIQDLPNIIWKTIIWSFHYFGLSGLQICFAFAECPEDTIPRHMLNKSLMPARQTPEHLSKPIKFLVTMSRYGAQGGYVLASQHLKA